MSVEKVIESPENHEERLTRRDHGLESTNYRGRRSEIETQTNAKGRRSEKWKKEGEGNSS